MTPFAHAFAYAIKKTPYAFFAKITLCMYILCGRVERRVECRIKCCAYFTAVSHGRFTDTYH